MLDTVDVSLDCNCRIQPCFVDALKRHLVDNHPLVIGTTTADAPVIARILVGSKQIRLGAQPDAERLVHLTELIRRYMRIGAPIEMHTMWGATKAYAQFEHKGVDALDLLGLRRFACLNTQVKQLYPPGLKVRICREDITEVVLTSTTPQQASETRALSRVYGGQFRDLNGLLGLDFINIVEESELAAEMPAQLPYEAYLRRIRNNAGAFFRYWLKLHTTNFATQDIDEFYEVKKLGLAGPVTKSQWDHYIERVRSEHPKADLAERAWHSSMYLSNAVTRSSLKFVHGTTSDDRGTIPPIRSSFVPYPPGTPRKLYMGRVEYKVKDSKHSKKTVAPWSGYGLMIPRSDSYVLSAVGVREYRELQEVCSPVVLRLSGMGRSVAVRADVGPVH